MDLARCLIQRINVGDSLTRSAAARPGQLAVVDGPRRWTYAQFNGWVNQIAHGLAGRGYTRGDALGLASGNSAEFLAVYFACAKLGLVCVPVNLGWRPDEVAYVPGHSGARGLAVETQLIPQVRDAVVKVAAVADVVVLPGTGASFGAVGTPITGVRVAIMGPDGGLLPPGAQGEIVYRGPSTMAGYLPNASATGAAFAHGWFHSGDVGRFGPDGVLWFADRYKDVIKSGRENVASIEVEKAVYAAGPDVAEAVVVGLPHERWSEAITAVVVARPGAAIDPAGLLAALRGRLDGCKVPKAVIAVDELPKTSTGKIQKNVVRDQHPAPYDT